MVKINIRELHNNTGSIVRSIEEPVYITDRGKETAILIPCHPAKKTAFPSGRFKLIAKTKGGDSTQNISEDRDSR